MEGTHKRLNGVSNFLIYILEFQVKGIYLVGCNSKCTKTCGRQTLLEILRFLPPDISCPCIISSPLSVGRTCDLLIFLTNKV